MSFVKQISFLLGNIIVNKKKSIKQQLFFLFVWWRRRELNSRPKRIKWIFLHVYFVIWFNLKNLHKHNFFKRVKNKIESLTPFKILCLSYLINSTHIYQIANCTQAAIATALLLFAFKHFFVFLGIAKKNTTCFASSLSLPVKSGTSPNVNAYTIYNFIIILSTC